MKTDSNWCRSLGLCLVALTIVFVAASCGGGGGGVASLDANSTVANTPTPGDTGRGEAVAVSESEIGNLTATQQALLADQHLGAQERVHVRARGQAERAVFFCTPWFDRGQVGRSAEAAVGRAGGGLLAHASNLRLRLVPCPIHIPRPS